MKTRPHLHTLWTIQEGFAPSFHCANTNLKHSVSLCCYKLSVNEKVCVQFTDMDASFHRLIGHFIQLKQVTWVLFFISTQKLFTISYPLDIFWLYVWMTAPCRISLHVQTWHRNKQPSTTGQASWKPVTFTNVTFPIYYTDVNHTGIPDCIACPNLEQKFHTTKHAVHILTKWGTNKLSH